MPCLVACGSESSDSEEDVCPAPEVSADDVAHACIHVQAGPFERITAGVDEPSDEPLDATHTAYSVRLPEAPTAWVSFDLPEPGRYVVYQSAPLELAMAGQGCVSDAIVVSECPDLVAAHAIAVDGPSDMSIDAGGLSSVVLVLERE